MYLFNWFLNPLKEKRNQRIWKHYRAQGININRCGAAISAMMIAAHYNVPVTVDELMTRVTDKLFWNIRDISRVIGAEGLPVRNHSIQMKLHDLKNVIDTATLAAIHVDGFHFVIVRKVGAAYQVIDPMNGIANYDIRDIFRRLSYDYIVTI